MKIDKRWRAVLLVTMVATMTSLVLFGLGVFVLRFEMKPMALASALPLVSSIIILVILALAGRFVKPSTKNLFELVIGRNNCGLFLTTKDEAQFRGLVASFLSVSHNNFSLFKFTNFLREHDPQGHSISYQTVAVAPLPMKDLKFQK